jgi:hypothetical protein
VCPEWIAITYVCRHWRDVALNHHSLWGLITPNLSLAWIKALMDRSGSAPVDAELRVGQATIKRLCISVDEAIGILSGCTRLRSLRILGARRDVCALLDALRTPTPVRSLALSLWERGPPVFLPEDLFGGQAPIRRIDFSANRYIVAPHWLLRGVTHFTSGEQIALSILLDALRQMPALTHFALQHCRAHWQDSEAPSESPIEMPHLEELFVHADSPRYFAMLDRRLATPRSTKRRLELRTLALGGWDRWLRWFADMLPVIEAANGLRHVHLCGGAKEGTFRAWTGDADTPFEDAAMALEMYWYGSPTTPIDSDVHLSSPVFHLGSLCDLLGATAHGRFLVLEGDPARAEVLPPSCWWGLLEKLPGVERLELHPNAVTALYVAWDDVAAPAILSALKTVKLIPVVDPTPPAASVFATAMTTTTTTTAAAAIVVEPRTQVATTIRKGFISRIVPSKAVRTGDSHPRAPVVGIPSPSSTVTVRTNDDSDAVRAATAGVRSEAPLEELIALMQGHAGRHRR